MSRQQPQGPFCQSCSMPLDKPEDFGTEITGYRVNDYCRHCFARGVFTEPEISMQAMIDRCVAIMAEQKIMPAAAAKRLLADVMPRLKRWQETAAAI